LLTLLLLTSTIAPARAVEIDALETDQPIGWTSSTKMLPNGDGGLIVEKADGTDVLTLSSAGQVTAARFQTNVSGSPYIYSAGNSTLTFVPAGTAREHLTDTRLIFGSGIGLCWSDNASAAAGTVDTFIYRDAANSLALRNSTNAQSFGVYNTYTDASNYERLRMYASSNTFFIKPEAAGTGTVRTIVLDHDTASLEIHNSLNRNFRFSVGNFLPLTNGNSNLGGTGNYFDSAFIEYHYLKEQASPPTSVADTAIIYAEDNGSGKTRLMVQFGTGAAQQIAIEP
ncbi:MAG: hypothetical protein KDA51_09990, partial [Planctomycetales bacterium]|nr:hypothetical protein [Planctomycetales bacterium]